MLTVTSGLESSQDKWVLGWFGLAVSGWDIAVGNYDLGGVTYRWNGEVTYSLSKVVNFVIYRVDVT
jgi:hypothetical protein